LLSRWWRGCPKAGCSTIVHDRPFPHPVETVWAALRDPVALASWLMPNDARADVSTAGETSGSRRAGSGRIGDQADGFAPAASAMSSVGAGDRAVDVGLALGVVGRHVSAGHRGREIGDLLDASPGHPPRR
jgi:hypothetical protein